MKPRLIILSDLWGVEKSEWLRNYLDILAPIFTIKFYDSCDLAKVDKSIYEEQHLHRQFLNGGIERATKNLLELEKQKVNVLAFSIGGTIAWKAQSEGLQVNNIHAISSTRLRHETKKPDCHIKLYFGANDEYQPSAEWLDRMDIKARVFQNKGHQLYLSTDCIHDICEEITKT